MGINELIQVGNQIRKYREKRGLSQKAVAQLTGIPYSTYSNYENNNREPNIEQLQKIAEVLQVPVINFTHTGYVMGLKEEELRSGLDGMKFGFVTQSIHDFLAEDEYRLLSTYYKLNDEGRAEAINRVEELTEIKRYQSGCHLGIPGNAEKMKQQRIEAESKKKD